MSDEIINFRVPKELKDAFAIAAKSEDMTISQLLRRMMRDAVDVYMTRNAQGSLLEPSKAVKAGVDTKPKKKTAQKARKSPIPDSWRAK